MTRSTTSDAAAECDTVISARLFRFQVEFAETQINRSYDENHTVKVIAVAVRMVHALDDVVDDRLKCR